MEEAYQIFEYLPIFYQNPSQQEYLQFLWESYEINDQNDQHTFAFIAYHMIYMSAVYSILWKIRLNKSKEFTHALIGFSADDCKKIENAEDWFILHVINERRVFSFLKLLGFSDSDIGQFRKIVKDRNDVTHSNGVISYKDQNRLDTQVATILRNLETIQSGFSSLLDVLLVNFLKSSWNIEEIQSSTLEDEVTEVFVRENLLSNADIEHIARFDISTLVDIPNFEEIKALYELIIDLHN